MMTAAAYKELLPQLFKLLNYQITQLPNPELLNYQIHLSVHPESVKCFPPAPVNWGSKAASLRSS
jgi:hypothetical protein